MHNLKANDDVFLPLVQECLFSILDDNGNIKRHGPAPQMPDIQILTLSLVAESLSIHSEHHLFCKLKAEYGADFPLLITRPQFNRRRRWLQPVFKRLQQALVAKRPTQEQFIVDLMPIPTARIRRAYRTKACTQDPALRPAKGRDHAHRCAFFGFKLHALIDKAGVFHDFQITSGNVHDVKQFMSLASTLENCTIIADKGYIGVQYQKNLFETAQVERITPLRKNQKKTSKWNYYLAKTRRRIETSFSQLTDQFAIKQNLAKSFNGFWAR